MAELFLMPKLGMDMEEGVIGAWRKAEGDTVAKGEILAEIETDKSVVEVEATVSGTILKIFYGEGEALECGTPIACIGQPGEAIPEPTAAAPAAAEAAPAAPAAVQDERIFRMPKLGMDMEEGVIGAWRKAEGDTVQKGEILAEIETDKSVVEVEATVDGTILKLYYGEGEALECGTPIAFIGNPGDPIPDPDAVAAPTEAAPAPVEVAPVEAAPVAAPTAQSGDRVIASPRARRAAGQQGVDLSRVTGTGENGRIVEQDVLDFAATAGSMVRSRTPKDEVVPLTGIRKVIAGRMVDSLREMAQTNTRMDVDMTNLIAFRKQLNDRFADRGIKVSYVDLLVAICARALIEHPDANVSLEADGIHYKNYANIGIAVDSQKGLVVPVVKDADILSIPAIAQRSKELIGKARDGALRAEDMKGGTFTISNLGMFEVDSFTAIVNPPETCILAVGRIADRAVVVDGQIVVRPMMNLCLSYDHRVIDGAPSARFLQCVKHYIENPVWLLV